MALDAKLKKAMKAGYWKRWNEKVQKQIDENIEKYRKADADWKIEGLKAGTDVKVEQISHKFIFGAHIFNFDQLGTDERNEKYKALYGTLFNSATVAFYWKTLEPEEGNPRFAPQFRDTAEFWNTVKDPNSEPHWRRPAPDPVIDFCEEKGIRIHGHPLYWGNNRWMYPDWMLQKLPAEWRDRFEINEFSKVPNQAKLFEEYSAEQLEKMFPEYAVELQSTMAKRFAEIAFRYGHRVHSWDVCNESAADFERGAMVPGSKLCKSVYGLMPGDYTYRSFKMAESLLPDWVKLNINDYHMGQPYPDQTNDLKKRGCKIDIMGAQMHLFNQQYCLDIADGKSDCQDPQIVMETMKRLSQADLPIHLSEITITSPNNDERGQAIQAVMTYNLYRLWFSTEKMMGITWWNVVDGCGAPGEPAVSGLFTRNMEPKPAYFVLNDLINNEWKTKADLKAGKSGRIQFRGFRGNYRITWTDPKGEIHMKFMELD